MAAAAAQALEDSKARRQLLELPRRRRAENVGAMASVKDCRQRARRWLRKLGVSRSCRCSTSHGSLGK